MRWGRDLLLQSPSVAQGLHTIPLANASHKGTTWASYLYRYLDDAMAIALVSFLKLNIATGRVVVDAGSNTRQHRHGAQAATPTDIKTPQYHHHVISPTKHSSTRACGFPHTKAAVSDYQTNFRSNVEI